ncbi:MAG: YcgL domain-containing protein [Stenotrophomonas sp.]
MQAYVYKSQRKQDTYVYLAKRDDFAAIPASVGATLAPYTFVLEVALTPDRRLAQADATLVRANLVERGFHLQLPPQPLAPVKVPRIDGRDD